MKPLSRLALTGLLIIGLGCATQKESHTARTGVEQLLVSSAIDRSLDQVDLQPLAKRRVFVETKYLDCVDKNYIIVSLHHRLLNERCKLVNKPEEADVIVEVGSGAVGTDGQDMFVGIPEIPLPPPSPIAIPRMALFQRKQLNGTAKVLVVAYDAKTTAPLINSGAKLARTDFNNWNVIGTGTVTTGSVPEQIAAASGGDDFNVMSAANLARQAIVPKSEPSAEKEVQPVSHREGQ